MYGTPRSHPRHTPLPTVLMRCHYSPTPWERVWSDTSIVKVGPSSLSSSRLLYENFSVSSLIELSFILKPKSPRKLALATAIMAAKNARDCIFICLVRMLALYEIHKLSKSGSALWPGGVQRVVQAARPEHDPYFLCRVRVERRPLPAGRERYAFVCTFVPGRACSRNDRVEVGALLYVQVPLRKFKIGYGSQDLPAGRRQTAKQGEQYSTVPLFVSRAVLLLYGGGRQATNSS